MQGKEDQSLTGQDPSARGAAQVPGADAAGESGGLSGSGVPDGRGRGGGGIQRLIFVVLVAGVAFAAGMAMQSVLKTPDEKDLAKEAAKEAAKEKSKKKDRPKISKKPKPKRNPEDEAKINQLSQQLGQLKRQAQTNKGKLEHLDKAYEKLSQDLLDKNKEIDQLQIDKARLQVQRVSGGQGGSASVVPPPESVAVIDELTEPDNSGLEYIKEIQVIDLRSWREVPSGQLDKKYSPVTQTRTLTVRKTDNDLEYTVLEFSSTGSGVDVRCLTHRFELFSSQNAPVRRGVELDHALQMRAYMDGQATGETFKLVTEATYWNAFQDIEQQRASVTAYDDTDELTLILVFPTKKPIDFWSLSVFTDGAKEAVPYEGKGPFLIDNNRVFSWTITKPKAKSRYEVQWKW